ncbi:MAG: xanthine dehydrogenase family protein subunit M [Planctomycetota bacterium]
MKQFRMSYPTSVEQTLRVLAATPPAGDVRVIAGGQDLLGEMKDHLAEPDHLVNLARVEALRGLRWAASGELEIGAMTTLAAIAGDAGVRASLPLLAEAVESVATPQIRQQGTIGGNLCQRPRCWYYRHEKAPCFKKGGSECFAFTGMSKYNAILGGGPSYIVHPSDVAPALVASDATLTLRGPGDGAAAVRTLPVQEFFTLPFEADVTKENVLRPGEIVTAIGVPDRRGWRGTYLEVRERQSFDFALAAVALALRMEGERIAAARLVLGGVAPVPWRCAAAEALLAGRRVDDETCRLAGEEALRGAAPLDHNAYKVPMTKGLITKALRQLARLE